MKASRGWYGAIMLSVFSSSLPSTAQTIKVYQYKDAKGNIVYSDRPPLEQQYKELFYDCFACGAKSKVNFENVALIMDRYSDEIRTAEQKSGLPSALIRAMIHAESGFRADAISTKGAIGLTQLMPETAKELGVNPYDAGENILGGSVYLAGLLKRYDGDLTKAAAAYNAGAATVDEFQGVPPFPETTAYIDRLQILLKRYQNRTAP